MPRLDLNGSMAALALLRRADDMIVPYSAIPDGYSSVSKIKRLLGTHGLRARHFQQKQGMLWFTVERGNANRALAALRRAGFGV